MIKLFRFLNLIFICLYFPLNRLQAQAYPENTKFKHLSSNDGLSDNNVSAIFQDKEGFMWLGTADGLNKYDGYKFTIYRHDPNDSNSIGSGSIRCIYEDKDGLIWIGAEASLSTLDRKTGKFTVYKNDPENPNSLSNDIVTDIKQDKESNMWISTYGGGLNQFDKKTGKFSAYKNDPHNPNSISSDYVLNSFEDSKGVIWIATFEGRKGGLNSFDKNSKKFTYYTAKVLNKKEAPPSQLLNCIKEDSKGILWIGNGNMYDYGLTAFDKEKKIFIHQFTHDPKNKCSLSNNIVECLYDDSKGYVWAGTLNGLNILDKNTGKFTVFKNDPTNPTSLSNNSIQSIYKDNQGLIWIGTAGGGVNMYDQNNNNFIVFKNDPGNEKSLNNNQVNSIYEDSKGSIWMGTGIGGLTNFDKSTGEFNYFEGECEKRSVSRVNGIQETNGQLWLGILSFHVLKFDRYTHKYTQAPFYKDKNNVPDFIYSLLVDSKKTIWVATPHCLFNFNATGEKVIRYENDPKNLTSISENFTFNLFEDNQNNIWVSTRSTGLNVFERNTGKFFCFKNDPKNPNSINNNVVNTIYQAPNDVLWLGTSGGGLDALVLQKEKNRFTQGYTFYHFTDKDGLPNNIIDGILPGDDGELWVCTNQGLCKFTPPKFLSAATLNLEQGTDNPALKNDKPGFKNYDVNDGLPCNSFTGAVYKTKDKRMYFGSSDGLLSFLPRTIKDNTHKPPVYFTSFKIFEKEFPLDTPIAAKHEITLSYKQSFFSFEFVALDYAQSSKNQYAFMMQGFDSKWIYIGNRRYASYTNLDPGEYVFRVKASNNNGVWNEQGASIRIIITPPFWRTKTFYALFIATLLLLVYTYIKWRERKLIMEKKILENRVTKRTKELVEEKEKVELANTEIIQKNKKIETAYTIIEEKNHQITDSINYAKRIQQAILPDKKEIYTALPQSFILYKPKDIVSGDFYFFSQTVQFENEKKETNEHSQISKLSNHPIIFIAAADCTGHGVPGAFMSMIGYEKLNDAVQQSNSPGEILMLLNKGIKQTLHQSKSDDVTRDGMDIAFCTIDLTNNKVLYSGANRPFILIRKNSTETEEIKATKNAIGGFTENNQHFETHEIYLKAGDTFYIFTDGYADQFGGEKGKKFTTKKFKELLLRIQNESMQEQEKQLNEVIESWSLNNEQVDDILVIGIRI